MYVLVLIVADPHTNKKQRISPDKHALKPAAQVCLLLKFCKRAFPPFDKSIAVAHVFQLHRETVNAQPF